MIFSRLQRAKSIRHSFISLPSVTRKIFLDPSLKKVIYYFVVSLDMKFGCNVCLLIVLAGSHLSTLVCKARFSKENDPRT